MTTSIPFNDLSRGTAALRKQIDEAVARVIASGWFVLGPEHDALESELAEFLGTKHAINVGNGTDALELALAALNVGAGDYVVTVANAGAYATTAIRQLNAMPIYADVDDKTLLMSRNTLETALAFSPEIPKAIVVTHLYGALAPMNELLEVAESAGIPILEDCAQSFGAKSKLGRGGSLADISTTSFYPTKNLGALGDGGAVFTNRDDLADSVRRMRQYGWKSKYNIQYSRGRNSRLDEMQAAILRTKLPFLDESNEKRRQIHSEYENVQISSAHLVNKSNPSFIAHLAVLVSESRDLVRSRLADAGIATDVHYPIPDNRQGFPDFEPISTPLEVTDWASKTVFSIPLFPELTDLEVEQITLALGNN